MFFENLLTHPDESFFGCRRELTEHFLRAFFHLLWGVSDYRTLTMEEITVIRSKLRLTVNQGPKQERAIIQVRLFGSSDPRIVLASCFT